MNSTFLHNGSSARLIEQPKRLSKRRIAGDLYPYDEVTESKLQPLDGSKGLINMLADA